MELSAASVERTFPWMDGEQDGSVERKNIKLSIQLGGFEQM